MDTFAYKGISDGKYVEGNIEAINSDEASHKLKEQKIIITNLIRAAKGKKTEEKKGEEEEEEEESSCCSNIFLAELLSYKMSFVDASCFARFCFESKGAFSSSS